MSFMKLPVESVVGVAVGAGVFVMLTPVLSFEINYHYLYRLLGQNQV